MPEASILSIAGKIALVGGTGRISAVVAHRLAKEGVNLAIRYRRSKTDAERLDNDVSLLMEHSCLTRGDVGEDVRRMVNVAVRR